MDSPAPKRRRTSPRIAPATADNTNTTAAVAAPPPPPPAFAEEEPPSTQANRKKRPDFASPTKASLARHNPQILARRKSAQGAAAGAGAGAGAGDADEQPASRPGSQDSEESLSQLLTTQLEAGPVFGESGSRDSRISPGKPKPFTRPLPPPPPDGEDLIDPFRRRGLRRSPLGSAPEAEPELPPTPSQLGIEDPVVTTPPAGIHSSSPSRKKMKRKMHAEMKSSPLKKPPIRPATEQIGGASENDPLANPQATPGPTSLPIHPARRVRPEHLHGEKLRKLEELRKEEEALSEDLKNIKAWNTKLWDKVVAQEHNDELAEDFVDDERTTWIHSHLLEDHEKRPLAPDASASLLQAAQNPSMWLPFGSVPTLQPPAPHEPENLADPISHHPLKMTVEEELPFLQAFSPLTFTSTPPLFLDRSQQEDFYFREISVRATDMPTLFAASIVVIVDDQDHMVEELRVPRLDRNAETELRPFIDSVVSGKKNRAMDRNVSIVTWAMGEWYRIAARRARFWHALEIHTASPDALAQSSREVSSRNRTGPGRPEATKGAGERDLLPYMGYLSKTLPLDHWGDEASVRIEWKISFDWTGEARSKIGLGFSGPGEWHQADERGSLGGTSKIFDGLIRGTGDVTDAARRILALFAKHDR